MNGFTVPEQHGITDITFACLLNKLDLGLSTSVVDRDLTKKPQLASDIESDIDSAEWSYKMEETGSSFA